MSLKADDQFFDTLGAYSGQLDDRKKAYLVATEGYHQSLTIQDMEFFKLRSLGYLGSLDDMWADYLIDLGGIGLESMDSLLGLTFYAAAGAVDELLLEGGDLVLLEDSNTVRLEGAF